MSKAFDFLKRRQRHTESRNRYRRGGGRRREKEPSQSQQQLFNYTLPYETLASEYAQENVCEFPGG